MAFFRQFPRVGYDYENNGVITNIIDIFRSVKVDSVFLDDMSTYQYYQVRNGQRPDITSSILYGTPDYYWTFFVVNEHLKTGLSGWPMASQEFEDFIELEYSGTVIDTEPVIVTDPDGLQTSQNSLAGKFKLNEIITGNTSMATGLLKEKNLGMSQLILSNVSGNFRSKEIITGNTSNSAVQTARVYSHRDAPHHYVNASGLEMYCARLINESNTAAGIDPAADEDNLTPVSYYEYELELNEERGNIRVVRPNMIFQFAQLYNKLINQ